MSVPLVPLIANVSLIVSVLSHEHDYWPIFPFMVPVIYIFPITYVFCTFFVE